MSYSKRRKSVMNLFRFIWNNLIGAFEVWDKARGTLDHLEDSAGRVLDVADVVKKTAESEVQDAKQLLSRDYQDAESYVESGVSEAKDVWKSIKKAF